MALFDMFKKGVDVDNVIDKASSGIDKLFFTKEEKADFNLKLADCVAQYAKDTLSENTIRSKTRRFISILFVVVFLLLVLLYVYFSMFTEKDTSTLLLILKDSPLSSGIILILAFFYGGYYLKGLNIFKKDK